MLVSMNCWTVSGRSSKLKQELVENMSILVSSRGHQAIYQCLTFGMRFASMTMLDIVRMGSNTASIVAQQMQEMQMIREKVFNMEQTHLQLKQK